MGKLRDIATGQNWSKIPNADRIAMLEADAEIERYKAEIKRLRAALEACGIEVKESK